MGGCKKDTKGALTTSNEKSFYHLTMVGGPRMPAIHVFVFSVRVEGEGWFVVTLLDGFLLSIAHRQNVFRIFCGFHCLKWADLDVHECLKKFES